MRKPDMEGQGKAWVLPCPERRRDGTPHATVRNWLIKGEFHAFWNHWLVFVVHLRDVDGMKAPSRTSPDMTHEFIIYSLDPGEEKEMREYDPENLPFPLPVLEPVDCAIQFKCLSDAHALQVCDNAIKEIMDGRASPDSEFRNYWAKTILSLASGTKSYGEGLH